MSSFWWGPSAFDELVEKATSELLPAGQVDLALHLEISDQIRSKKINAKEAMRSFKQRLTHKNPNVVIATLSLIDTCVKNSGNSFVKEVATRDFMEEMTRLVKMPTGCNQDVKDKVLSLVQVWGIAAKGNNALSYISGTFNLLRAEGYVFPPVTEKIDSILLETAVAPDWTDSDVCERCRTPFTLTNRKHHCRQCGQTFCQQCSAKSIPLPHLGINETVRVCDGCYIKVKLAKVADKETAPQLLAPPSISSSLAPTYTPSIKKETVNDDQFEEDLKKAIELSKKESDQRKKFEAFISTTSKKKTAEEEEEANMAAAIAASLQDVNKDDLSHIDMENIELFSTLMQRVQGNDVSRDTQINKLYVQIGALQPKLVKTLNETSKKHELFVELHNKLNHAVRAYDKLIQDRLSNHRSYQQTNYGYYHQPSYPYQTPLAQHTPLVQHTPIVYQPTGENQPLYPAAANQQPYQSNVSQQYQSQSQYQPSQQPTQQYQPSQQPTQQYQPSQQPTQQYQASMNQQQYQTNVSQQPAQQYQTNVSQQPAQQYQTDASQRYQTSVNQQYQPQQQQPIQQYQNQTSYPMSPTYQEEAPLIEL